MTIAHILSGLPTWEGHVVNHCHPELENGKGQPVVFYRLMSTAMYPASHKGLTMLNLGCYCTPIILDNPRTQVLQSGP